MHAGTGHFGKFSTWTPVPPVPVQTFTPVPNTSVTSVQHQYRYRTLRWVRYDINVGTGHFGKFGTWTSVPPVPVQTFTRVPNTLATSVQHHRYRTLRWDIYINAGTGHFGKFGTWTSVPPVPVQTFTPVPNTSVTSVQHQYRYRTLRWVRYDINVGTGHFGKFGTTSLPVPYRTQPCSFYSSCIWVAGVRMFWLSYPVRWHSIALLLCTPLRCECVVFTLNRSFSSTSVHLVSVLILHPREVQILWSQTAVRQRNTKTIAINQGKASEMLAYLVREHNKADQKNKKNNH